LADRTDRPSLTKGPVRRRFGWLTSLARSGPHRAQPDTSAMPPTVLGGPQLSWHPIPALPSVSPYLRCDVRSQRLGQSIQ
jgi:hypothetical protein